MANRQIRQAFSCFSLLAFIASSALAQDSYRVGEIVELHCTCFGPYEWVKAKVEAIDGNNVKVRYGNGKYHTQVVSKNSADIRGPKRAAQTASENQLRDAFIAEAGKYMQTVKQFAPFYDEKYISGGAPNGPADWQKAMNELAQLDQLCKNKYAGVTNDLSHYLREGIVENRYAVWCEIAAKRNELERPARTSLAKMQVSLTVTKDNLNFAFNHQKNRVPDETQQLMYDNARWKQLQIPKYQPRFAEFGIEMPGDFFTEVEKRADELKQLIEQTAPNRIWEQPSFHDPAVEAFIKARYAADPDYRGIKILKSGVDYKTWVERRSLSYIGSDSTYRYYKVEYNSYKRGWVLMKLPNQPFCQASEWIAGRGGKGMVVVSLGGSGIFMRCQ